MMSLLLDRGADPNTGSPMNLVISVSPMGANRTEAILGMWVPLGVGHPIEFAVLNGNLEAVRLLLNSGADVNLSVGWPSEPALNLAVQPITRYSVYLKDSESRVLERNVATTKNKSEILRLLLERGADPNLVESEWSTPPLAAAARFNNAEAAQILIEAGANANVKNFQGDTALHVAARWGALVCTVGRPSMYKT